MSLNLHPYRHFCVTSHWPETGDEENTNGEEMEVDDEEDDTKAQGSSNNTIILRDFNYKLQCMLQERGRKLDATWNLFMVKWWYGFKHFIWLFEEQWQLSQQYRRHLVVSLPQVKSAMATFDPTTMYGNRTGYQDLLLVSSADSRNIFRRSPMYRTSVVSGINMLARSDMVKPPPARTDARYGGEGRFTKVQEMRQDWNHSNFWYKYWSKFYVEFWVSPMSCDSFTSYYVLTKNYIQLVILSQIWTYYVKAK